MWSDLSEALNLAVSQGYKPRMAALNYAGIFVPVLDHWFITRPDLVSYFAVMRENMCPERTMSGVRVATPGVPVMPRMCETHEYFAIPTKGTIAMFAVKVLSSLGYGKIILAGVPLDDKTGYFFRAPWETFWMSDATRPHWEEMAEKLRPQVRSMSGYTSELLGKPNKGWLHGGDTQ